MSENKLAPVHPGEVLSDALAHLAAQADTLPEPYLITGPQAAYLYHRWLQPISKMVDVCIPPESTAIWRTVLCPSWTVLTEPPTFTQMRRATRIVILTPHLTKERQARGVVHKGLTFISAEDLCLDLLRNAKTQIGLSEIAALLIKQKDALDWPYLFRETSSSWLSHRLKEIMQTINHEAGRPLIKTEHVETQIVWPTNTVRGITSIRADTVSDILRPLHAQWELANV